MIRGSCAARWRRGWPVVLAGVALACGVSMSGAWARATTDPEFGDAFHSPKIDVEKTPRAAWRKLEESAWIADGSRRATTRIIYEFYDANCAYCQRFWHDTQPWVRAGKVQIRYIPVGLLEADSLGKAAALLAARHPAALLNAYAGAWPDGKLAPLRAIPSDLQQRLAGNLELMHDLGLHIVPGVVVQDGIGAVHLWPGLPARGDLPGLLGPIDGDQSATPAHQ